MTIKYILITTFIFFISLPKLLAQNTVSDKENEFYKITTVPIPEDIVLEVGGMAFMPDNRLAVTTRRGEIWLIQNPYMKNGKQPQYKKFASGLHEPLGLAYRNGALYTTQRAELTKITDTNQDDRGDKFETIYSWPLSGNYHEYSYGPLFLPNGDMLVTLNLGWIGYGASLVKWRGWMLKITEDGEMTPIATGLRSPAGFGFDMDGEVFYAENQGDWIGSGRITHLEEGDFAGNPAGLKWSGEPLSPLDLKPNQIPDSVGLMHEFAKEVASLKIPTVWFPHTIMGISTSAILTDTTGGKFGPFEGQMLVGDQGHSKIMRVVLEKVNGEYQGACFPFKEGFSSGVLRFAWGTDGSLFVGMTSRGWSSTGKDMYGLQKLSWSGKTPFEIKTMKAMSDGFELEFTEPVQKSVAEDINSYSMTSFNYSYHRSYGSPIIQQQTCPIVAAMVSEDRMKVRLHIDGLRAGYIHEIKANGIRSSKGNSLLHPVGYYTLNNIPEGDSSQPMIASSNTEVTEKDNTISCGWDESKRITEMPSDWNNEADIVINIGTEPGLKFSVKNFEVPAGAKVQLTFTNNDDMLHNLVVAKPGTIEGVSTASMQMGLEGPQKGYIPNSDNIIYHTCILQPETSESIYFVVPKEGDYPYVCTFPGHAQVMRGVMKVTPATTASR
ncbi:plastocyanin/azurin family copper-binding protein [Catalinimonas niigatensis]|uniref:plastocyanin/azurin family copper-binding protein n=1 Tax=Catalinimonas niigatensis TaxID=1397264 RepID=UPI002665CCB4|nr:plastocyanin/azurin family copper-binding protein [Catalinimonas niigatensis]WPP51004.1 plastocyanin/azurin family copper-binding protein [Catalinimonas niigatensis]